MKRKNISRILLLALAVTLIGASATATADAIGDGYELGGYQVGYWVIGGAVVVGVLAFFEVLDRKKVGTGAVVLLIIGAFLLVPISTPEEETPTGTIYTTPTPTATFDVTGTPVITGTEFITTSVYDEDTRTMTVPLTVADASDGNLTGYKTGLNLSFDPITQNADTTDLFTIEVATQYLTRYGGEYVLDEDGTGYLANVTTEDGTSRYDGRVKLTGAAADYALIEYEFVNATSGSWVSELDAIGDTVTLQITATSGSWSETYTVRLIVVSYTA